MKDLSFKDVIEWSKAIRKLYHALEVEHHGGEWRVEEDALAFLTDAGLAGRLTMSQQGGWPKAGDTHLELEHKLGECIWWLTVLAGRMHLDNNDALESAAPSIIPQINTTEIRPLRPR